jgi:hypothetical protein
MTLLFITAMPLSSFADGKLDNCMEYKSQIEEILISENVSTDYFYLAVCESGCRNVVSNKGAHGFFQVTRPIYKFYKPDSCTMEDIDNIKCNTIAAARYIKHLQERFSKMHILIKAYNRGGSNYIRHGTTREANSLSACVMKYVRDNK